MFLSSKSLDNKAWLLFSQPDCFYLLKYDNGCWDESRYPLFQEYNIYNKISVKVIGSKFYWGFWENNIFQLYTEDKGEIVLVFKSQINLKDFSIENIVFRKSLLNHFIRKTAEPDDITEEDS